MDPAGGLRFSCSPSATEWRCEICAPDNELPTADPLVNDEVLLPAPWNEARWGCNEKVVLWGPTSKVAVVFGNDGGIVPSGGRSVDAEPWRAQDGVSATLELMVGIMVACGGAAAAEAANRGSVPICNIYMRKFENACQVWSVSLIKVTFKV